MIAESRIIVLHTIKHGDNGLVLQCYSNNAGRQSLYLRVSSRNKVNISNIHRLSILDIITYSNGSSMPTIRELTPVTKLASIRTNIFKNTIAIFLSELLAKSIRESEANLQLFDFLCSSINILEHLNGGEANFHIHFIVHLSKMLGFMPKDNYSLEMPLFNISTAKFCEGERFFDGKYCVVRTTDSLGCFSETESALLHTLLNTRAIDTGEIRCTGELRLSFAKQMIRYLSHHLGMNLEIKSLDVLHEVFC